MFSCHSFEIQRKKNYFFGHSTTLSEIIVRKMKLFTVLVFSIELLGYKSFFFNGKIANRMIQVWNDNKQKKEEIQQLKNPSISKSKPGYDILCN